MLMFYTLVYRPRQRERERQNAAWNGTDILIMTDLIAYENTLHQEI